MGLCYNKAVKAIARKKQRKGGRTHKHGVTFMFWSGIHRDDLFHEWNRWIQHQEEIAFQRYKEREGQ